MSKPHEFLVGKDPIKEQLSCPKCGSKSEYYSAGQYVCELCGFCGMKTDFEMKQIATVDWAKFAKSCR
jgi:transcription initiation factor TFIIIB Brf1 subunit/transcription initiation factor TFIIB